MQDKAPERGNAALFEQKATQRRAIQIRLNRTVAKRFGFLRKTRLPARKDRRDDVLLF
jgi:hypothetical protein